MNSTKTMRLNHFLIKTKSPAICCQHLDFFFLSFFTFLSFFAFLSFFTFFTFFSLSRNLELLSPLVFLLTSDFAGPFFPVLSCLSGSAGHQALHKSLDLGCWATTETSELLFLALVRNLAWCLHSQRSWAPELQVGFACGWNPIQSSEDGSI